MIPIIRAYNLKKVFLKPVKTTVLENVSLEAYEQETIAIMGKSGEGKTTLLSILGTLDSPTSGQLEICGLIPSPANLSLLRNQHIGFIFQSFHLLEEYTVLENIYMPAKIAKESTKRGSPAEERARSLLKDVSLEHRAYFPVKFLSGGEKQRVAIARALFSDPDLLLADEPSGNLDKGQSHAIHELLLSLTKKKKKTLIVVTHDGDLASLCDRKHLLVEGKLTL